MVSGIVGLVSVLAMDTLMASGVGQEDSIIPYFLDDAPQHNYLFHGIEYNDPTLLTPRYSPRPSRIFHQPKRDLNNVMKAGQDAWEEQRNEKFQDYLDDQLGHNEELGSGSSIRASIPKKGFILFATYQYSTKLKRKVKAHLRARKIKKIRASKVSSTHLILPFVPQYRTHQRTSHQYKVVAGLANC